MKFSTPVDFKIGADVFIKTDPKQVKYQIRGYFITEHDVMYVIKNTDRDVEYYYGFELSPDIDITFKINAVM